MKYKEYAFNNFPVIKKSEEYDKARHEIVTKFTGIDNSIGVVEWGTIPYPGISDMDTYIILNPSINYSIYNIPNLSKSTWSVIQHNVAYMWEDLYKDIGLIDPWIVKHTTISKGNNYKYKKINKEHSSYERLSISHAIISNIVMLKEFIARIESSKVINVLHALETFRVFLYPIREVKKFIDDSVDYDDFINEINNLRDEWFSLSKKDQIKRLLLVYLQLKKDLDRLIDTIDDYVVSNHLTPCLTSIYYRRNYMFWKNIRVNFSNKKSEVYRILNVDFSIVSLPSSFLYYFEYIYYNTASVKTDDYLYQMKLYVKKLTDRQDLALQVKFPFVHFEYTTPSYKKILVNKYIDFRYQLFI